MIQATPAKECVVQYKDKKLLDYDTEINKLFLSNKFHVFPSKARANSALHNTIELDRAEGKPEPWNDYELIET